MEAKNLFERIETSKDDEREELIDALGKLSKSEVIRGLMWHLTEGFEALDLPIAVFVEVDDGNGTSSIHCGTNKFSKDAKALTMRAVLMMLTAGKDGIREVNEILLPRFVNESYQAAERHYKARKEAN